MCKYNFISVNQDIAKQVLDDVSYKDYKEGTQNRSLSDTRSSRNVNRLKTKIELTKMTLPKMWMVWFLFISAAVVENTRVSPCRLWAFRINCDIYRVEPNSARLLRIYTTLKPHRQPAYHAYNIGQKKVVAKSKFGNLTKWIGDIDVATVLPNKRVTLIGNGTYIRTGLEIRNNEAISAIVYARGGITALPNFPPAGFDKDRILRKAFDYGAKIIPYYGGGLKALLKKFWPNNSHSIWGQLFEQVKNLLDPPIQVYITNVLRQKIDYMKTRIQVLYNETNCRPNGQSVSVQYMNIAQDLNHLEDNFKFRQHMSRNFEWVNTVVIGLYATTVSMKVNFYELGIANPSFFNLTSNQVNTLKSYLRYTLYGRPNGAVSYIQSLYTKQVEDCYKKCYAGGLYDRMFNIRSHIALQGLEPVRLWIAVEKNPGSKIQPNVDVISYSEFFGRPTAELYSIATPAITGPPLTPELMASGVRRKLLSIEVFIWRSKMSGPARVGGARLTFDCQRTYIVGSVTREKQILHLNGAKIDKVRVFGRGQIDRLVFSLSDGRVVAFGSANHKNFKDLKLKNHHIVSIFMASDEPSLHGQAANFAVSYRLNDLSRSN